MKIVSGDLLKMAQDGKFDVIIHGANCFCTMGSGIAKQIRARFPRAYEADLNTLVGDQSKLGTYSAARYDSLTVVNAYCQFSFGTDRRQVDYEAVARVFAKIADNCKKKGLMDLKFGIPKIGAGLAGGNWKIIQTIIEEEMKGLDITLVIYKP